MKKNKLSAEETLGIINSQWATAHDIALVGAIGYGKALEIKKEITNDLKNKNILVPSGVVPMEEVVKKFNININYLKKVISK